MVGVGVGVVVVVVAWRQSSWCGVACVGVVAESSRRRRVVRGVAWRSVGSSWYVVRGVVVARGRVVQRSSSVVVGCVGRRRRRWWRWCAVVVVVGRWRGRRSSWRWFVGWWRLRGWWSLVASSSIVERWFSVVRCGLGSIWSSVRRVASSVGGVSQRSVAALVGRRVGGVALVASCVRRVGVVLSRRVRRGVQSSALVAWRSLVVVVVVVGGVVVSSSSLVVVRLVVVVAGDVVVVGRWSVRTSSLVSGRSWWCGELRELVALTSE
ncbi:hypothetical protein ACXZ9C_10570 [Streptococcus agalactiae]